MRYDKGKGVTERRLRLSTAVSMTRSRRTQTHQKHLRLVELFRNRRSMLVIMQDFPDPDAIGAAAALRELARASEEIACSFAIGGLVGRADNRALVRYLGLNLLNVRQINPNDYDLIALVDTQPGTGNNSLGENIVPHIVIDHHPIRRRTRSSEFFDIRRHYGATSTILYEYLKVARMEMTVPVATALLYGIRSDTNDLGREASPADVTAFLELYPSANKRILGRLAMERLPREYFQIMAVALKNARTYGNGVVTNLGVIDNPDMIGELADLLLRNEESEWAMCYGVYADTLLISLRTTVVQADAGKLMHRIVGRRGTGGGHSAMAGGQIPLNKTNQAGIRRIERNLVRRYLRVLKLKGSQGQRLILPRHPRKAAAPSPG